MNEEMRQEITMKMIEEIIIDKEKDRQQIHTITITTIIEEEVVDLITDHITQQREILEDLITIERSNSRGR